MVFFHLPAGLKVDSLQLPKRSDVRIYVCPIVSPTLNRRAEKTSTRLGSTRPRSPDCVYILSASRLRFVLPSSIAWLIVWTLAIGGHGSLSRKLHGRATVREIRLLMNRTVTNMAVLQTTVIPIYSASRVSS